MCLRAFRKLQRSNILHQDHQRRQKSGPGIEDALGRSLPIGPKQVSPPTSTVAPTGPPCFAVLSASTSPVGIEAMDRFGIDKPDLRYDMEPLGEGEMSFAPNRRVGSHAECWKAFPGRWRFSRLIWGIIELLAYPLSITRNHSSSSD